MNSIQINSYKQEINKYHRQLIGHLKNSVEIGIKIGNILIDVKKELQHGEFTEWINSNCGFTDRTARNYIKLYEYKSKTETVSDLSTAYKVIQQIEYEKNHMDEIKHRQEAFKKAKEKQQEYNNDKEWQDIKQKNKKEYISDSLTDDIINEMKKQNEDQKQFTTKINEGNKYQNTFFQIIDNYLGELKSDNERLEALQNMIKYCKRIAVKYQQNSIKDC